MLLRMCCCWTVLMLDCVVAALRDGKGLLQPTGQSLVSSTPDDLKTKHKIENKELNVEELHRRGPASGVPGRASGKRLYSAPTRSRYTTNWLCANWQLWPRGCAPEHAM